MLSSIKNAKIGIRFAFSLILPIVMLLVFSSHVVIDNRQTVHQMGKIKSLAELGPIVSAVVHELQKERGMSALYLGSKGAKFAKKLPFQRILTNDKQDNLKNALATFKLNGFGVALSKKVNLARGALINLEQYRDRVSKLQLSVPEMANYYTPTIAKLLSIIEEMAVLSSNTKISNAITAYTSFLQGKERAGIERAMGGAGFGAGYFSPVIYKRFIELIAQQETYFGLFDVYGSEQQKGFFNSTLVGPDVDEVVRMRKIVIDSIETNDTQDIEGPYWFETMTRKIDLLKRVEDRIDADLTQLAGEVQSDAQTVFYMSSLLTFIVLLITVGLVISVVRGITRPIVDITDAMTKLADGDMAVEITGVERGDEIGAMARAALVFREAMIKLAEAEERFRSISNSSSIAMIVASDHTGQIVSWNPAAESTFGYTREEIEGRPLTDIIPERYREAHEIGFKRAVESEDYHIMGKTVAIEGLRKGGIEFPVELSLGTWKQGDKKFFSAIIHDVTERNKTEEALRRNQKMEAIGELTGGLAHDFNNLLGIIIGNLDLMKRKIEDGSKLQKQLEKAQNAALRGSSLTRRLLNFSRKSADAHTPINVNEVIASLEELMGKSLTTNITVEVEPGENLWLSDLDPGDFEDSMINLSLNARDAMPDGGRLFIKTRNTVLDRSTTDTLDGIQPGEYVEIAVGDTGVGMAKEVSDKIFDPFFTTKGKDKGTGLGLAMVYGFTQRSKGHITVYSEDGLGTTFRIYLPRSVNNDDVASIAGESDEPLPRGKETVLIVDDEEELTAIAQSILEDLGYTIICAHSGDQAIQSLEENGDIDLVFSDVVMPGSVSGFDLAEIVAEKYPEAKILLTSGFTGTMQLSPTAEKWSDTLITKPYRDAELANRVRSLLDERK
jgi:PAS domain S-box-containing protein